MRFLTQLKTRIEAKTSTLTLYRGVQDIYPAQVTPTYHGDGVFGRGTYFGLDYETAEGYAKGYVDSFEQFALVLEYKASFKNLLTISEEHLEGLESGGYKNWLEMTDEGLDVFQYEEPVSFPADELTSIMAQDGYDGIRLLADNLGVPDGGVQLILPPDTNATLNLVSITFLLEDIKGFAKKLGIEPMDEQSVKVPKNKIKSAEKLLKEFL